MSDLKHLVVIAGPTAVGKTSLAIELAQHYGSVILSADSRQFYRELSIGTAKPEPAQLQAVPHYFINTKSVTELYGAGHFGRDAQVLLHQLFAKHDLVFLVGGSGLYIDALLNGVDDFTEVPAEVRSGINEELAAKGLSWLQNEVLRSDPAHYAAMDTQNPQRLVRALEVFRFTGRPYSSFLRQGNAAADKRYLALKVLVTTGREQLYRQINQRVDTMLQRGLLEEVKSLAAQRHQNALKTVGYRELYDYLDGHYDLASAVEKIKQHTRNYAKRQLTWFRNRDSFTEWDVADVAGLIGWIDAQRRSQLREGPGHPDQ